MLKQTMPLLFEAFSQYPMACARVRGSQLNPNLIGEVWVYPFLEGSLLVADIQGLPFSGFYGFHIHQRGPCIPGEGYTGFSGIGDISLRRSSPTPIMRKIARTHGLLRPCIYDCLHGSFCPPGNHGQSHRSARMAR